MSDLQDIKNRIHAAAKKAGRSDFPELVAVSKKQPLEKVMLVYEEGQRTFGENYVQDLIDCKTRMQALGALEVNIHFIGHLQTNKVKTLLPYVNTIHSVDSLKLLEEINSRAGAISKQMGCYFQVNIDEESTKGGFALEELSILSKKLPHFENIIALGLMCIPNPSLNSRAAFTRLKTYRDEYSKTLGSGLSMGMSEDFELAIECGATSLRIGSAIFGLRDYASSDPRQG